MTAAKARKLYDSEAFPEGSIGLKVMAAIEFVENGGEEAIIITEEKIEKDNCGTRITLK